MILLLLLMIMYSIHALTRQLSKLIWTSVEYLQHMFVNNREAREDFWSGNFRLRVLSLLLRVPSREPKWGVGLCFP